ncbi:MAG: glucose-1-phosphate adenylyltransferase [Lachnospiraceae bacterium]|nr:glucose-1-phosphate adenylyltransferase [Lachnospiraceae bacterium]
MQKKECIAMLLAGGQGSRLKALTKRIAKPAVSFGGKYRIIDFALSNCINSDINTVGILTQYKPYLLNSYIGNGEGWDLDGLNGQVSLLPPYFTEEGGAWYDGTADAIFKNIDFIDEQNPEYVLILSGDHLYKMDYNDMLQYHKNTKADLTVSVINVSLEEASRFGIMSVDKDLNITKFTEKPKKPDSTLASMGIYIFTWQVLRKALLEDSVDKKSEHDFGKNIIPKLLSEGKRLLAYEFKGYWKDIGTIDSYYEANMDLLKDNPSIDIFARDLRVYSNSNISPPQFVGSSGKVDQSLVSNGCLIDGKVTRSILSTHVTVEKGAEVVDSILLPNVVVKAGAKVVRAIVGEGSVISEKAKLGSSSKGAEIALIGDNEVYK